MSAENLNLMLYSNNISKFVAAAGESQAQVETKPQIDLTDKRSTPTPQKHFAAANSQRFKIFRMLQQ